MIPEQRLETQSTEGALFNTCVTSQHEGSLIKKHDPIKIISYLTELNKKYPYNSIPDSCIGNFARCGQPYPTHVKRKTPFGYVLTESPSTHTIGDCLNCGYHTEKRLLYRDSLRSCFFCSNRRKRKIFRQYLPCLEEFSIIHQKNHNVTKLGLRFFTNSPENYDDLKLGLEHIQKSTTKFFRRKNIKEKIKGSLGTFEIKYAVKDQPYYKRNKYGKKIIFGYHTKTGWNIHYHGIIFSYYLDNRVRGKCHECGQNILKKDKITGDWYCGNSKCNSTNVIASQHSNIDHKPVSWLVLEIEDSFKRKSVVDIKYLDTHKGILNYLLGYISINKQNFNEKQFAECLFHTRNRRLLHTTGCFREFSKTIEKGNKTPFKIINGQKISLYECPKCHFPSFVFTQENLDILRTNSYSDNGPPEAESRLWRFSTESFGEGSQNQLKRTETKSEFFSKSAEVDVLTSQIGDQYENTQNS